MRNPHPEGTVGAVSPAGDARSDPWEDRLIFVGGAPRSGTTLVQNILNCHPAILGAPEFLHLPDIVPVRAKLHASIERGWIDAFCDEERADHVLRQMILGFVVPLAEEKGLPLLSLKTPEDVKIFPHLLELFPGARFIQVVRDPRAVVASMLRVGRRAREQGWPVIDYTRDVLASIRMIETCLDAGGRAEEKAPDRVLTVSLEELTREPEEATRRISRFLGLDWSRDMLSPGGRKHMGEDAIANDVWYTKEEYRRDPDPAVIERWKDHLGAFEQATVTAAFEDDPILTRMGIAPAVADLTPAGRRAARWIALGARLTPPGLLGRASRMFGRVSSGLDRVEKILRIHRPPSPGGPASR